MICSWRLLERLRKAPNRNQRRTELFHSGAVRLKYEMQEHKSENSNYTVPENVEVDGKENALFTAKRSRLLTGCVKRIVLLRSEI